MKFREDNIRIEDLFSNSLCESQTSAFSAVTGVSILDSINNKYSLIDNSYSSIGVVPSAVDLAIAYHDILWNDQTGLSSIIKPSSFDLISDNCTINLNSVEKSGFSIYSKRHHRIGELEDLGISYQKLDSNIDKFERLMCAKARTLKIKPDQIGFEYPETDDQVIINIYFIFSGDINTHTLNVGDTINSN